MKCHGCSSLMVLDKQEFGAGSCTQWHSCPLCGKVRLTSQPESSLNSDPVTVGKRANHINDLISDQSNDRINDQHSDQSISQNLPLASYSTT